MTSKLPNNSSNVANFCHHCAEHITFHTCAKFRDHRIVNNEVMMKVKKPTSNKVKDLPAWLLFTVEQLLLTSQLLALGKKKNLDFDPSHKIITAILYVS